MKHLIDRVEHQQEFVEVNNENVQELTNTSPVHVEQVDQMTIENQVEFDMVMLQQTFQLFVVVQIDID
jgi:hypothetical protein